MQLNVNQICGSDDIDEFRLQLCEFAIHFFELRGVISILACNLALATKRETSHAKLSSTLG